MAFQVFSKGYKNHWVVDRVLRCSFSYSSINSCTLVKSGFFEEPKCAAKSGGKAEDFELPDFYCDLRF